MPVEHAGGRANGDGPDAPADRRRLPLRHGHRPRRARPPPHRGRGHGRRAGPRAPPGVRAAAGARADRALVDPDLVRDRRARRCRSVAPREARARRRRGHRVRAARRPADRRDRHRRQRAGRHHRADQHAQAGPADRARAARTGSRSSCSATPTAAGCPTSSGWRFSGLPAGLHHLPQAAPGQPVVPRAAAVLGPSYGDSALHAVDRALRGDARAARRSRCPGRRSSSRRSARSVSDDELGGPGAATSAGNAHLVVETEADAMDAIARVPVLPALERRRCRPRSRRRCRRPGTRPSSATIVPLGARAGYDMRDVFAAWPTRRPSCPGPTAGAPSLLCALARIEGRPVGHGRQPADRAGRRAGPARAGQGARVRRPVRHLRAAAGVPARRARPDDRHPGRAGRHPARLRGAGRPDRRGDACRKVGVVLRKAYGGGHFAMGGRPTGPDFLFAWPTRRAGLHGPGDRHPHHPPRAGSSGCWPSRARPRTPRWSSSSPPSGSAEAEPWEAAAHLSLDDVIEPADTRRVVATSIDIAGHGGRGERGPGLGGRAPRNLRMPTPTGRSPC